MPYHPVPFTFAQHPEWTRLLAVEAEPDDGCFVRGIVSGTRLERAAAVPAQAA